MRTPALLIALFAALPLILLAQGDTSTSVTGETGLIFEIERAEYEAQIDRFVPRNGQFAVLYGALRNDGTAPLCARGEDVPLTVDGTPYTPDPVAMDAFKRTLPVNSRDFIGVVIGHCVQPQTSDPVFVVYDISPPFESVALAFQGVDAALPGEWFGLSGGSGPDPASVGFDVIDATPEPTTIPFDAALLENSAETTDVPFDALLENPAESTASPDNVLAPGFETEAASESVPSADGAIMATVSADDTNARNCPSTECVARAVFDRGESFEVTALVQGWYQVRLLPSGLNAYIRQDLVVLPEGVTEDDIPVLEQSPVPLPPGAATAVPTAQEPAPEATAAPTEPTF